MMVFERAGGLQPNKIAYLSGIVFFLATFLLLLKRFRDKNNNKVSSMMIVLGELFIGVLSLIMLMLFIYSTIIPDFDFILLLFQLFILYVLTGPLLDNLIELKKTST